jgi:hypothetical protein
MIWGHPNFFGEKSKHFGGGININQTKKFSDTNDKSLFFILFDFIFLTISIFVVA